MNNLNKKIEIHGEIWKFDDIRDNIEWSKGQSWKFKKYNKENDHDHCLICYWTIGVSDNPETGEAYFCGGSTWVCKECYQKLAH